MIDNTRIHGQPDLFRYASKKGVGITITSNYSATEYNSFENSAWRSYFLLMDFGDTYMRTHACVHFLYRKSRQSAVKAIKKWTSGTITGCP